MNLDEILDKKICALCHQFPMGTGIICDNCRNDKKRMNDIMEKKFKRIELEKLEQIYKDFKNDNCIKCHVNPSLESMPWCVDCARKETYAKHFQENVKNG